MVPHGDDAADEARRHDPRAKPRGRETCGNPRPTGRLQQPCPASLNPSAQLPANAMGQADERKDEFMGALAALGGSAENGRLRSILEWDEDTYEAVRWNW